MKKILNFLANNTKLFVGIVIGLLLSVSTVYGASILFQSSVVGYNNINTGFKDTNGDDVEDVQTALDELYTKANSCAIRNVCPAGYAKINGSNGEYSCLTAESPEVPIRRLNTIGTSIADDDPDGNLRFIGANPNNYVWFNGQKWRIIGVFDGKLKIIEDPIGSYSFDTSRNTVNNGYGVNVWGPTTYRSDDSVYEGADLMKLLNPGYNNNTDLKCKTLVTVTDGVANCGDNSDDAYNTGLVNNSLWWNGGSGYCYNYGNHNVTSCNFSSTGLKSDEARNMIASTRWYLGSNSTSIDQYDGRMNASYLYGIERSDNPGNACSSGSYCTDGLNRITYWDGKVGLMYPSDFAYATGGGTIGREDCLSYNVGYNSDGSIANWTNTYTECKNDDWLTPASWSWSLSPRATSSSSADVFDVHPSGYVDVSRVLYAGSVRPTVYLKSDVKIVGGNGSSGTPFKLYYEES